MRLREAVDEEESFSELEPFAASRQGGAICCPVPSAGYLRSRSIREANRAAAVSAAAAAASAATYPVQAEAPSAPTDATAVGSVTRIDVIAAPDAGTEPLCPAVSRSSSLHSGSEMIGEREI